MIKIADHKKTILLVEDDLGVSQMLRLLLETHGYQVRLAANAHQTFQAVSKTIDLILLDVVLPDQSGFEICRQLKQMPEFSRIPIIMLSGKSLPKDVVDGLYLGADDYLIKPFEYEELVARMEAVMRRVNPLSFDTRGEFEGEDVVLELGYIVEQELIKPAFQPIYLLNDLKILGLEALCRLTLRYSTISNPEILFKLAQKFGLYEKLELVVWKKAVQEALPHLKEEKLFLNCTPYMIEGEKFPDIKALFQAASMKHQNVVIEITERTAIHEYKTFYEHLEKFRQDGFHFAIDDVGGGYASLESIVETKPEVVKIDQHIIQDIDKDPFKRSIVKFIVAFCKENHVISIAEGIETKEALETVKQLGVDAVQGFYLYKPTQEINIPQMLSAVKCI